MVETIEMNVNNLCVRNEKNGKKIFMRKLNLIVESTSNKKLLRRDKSDVI